VVDQALCRIDQVRGLSRIAQHFEQHARRFPQHLNPVPEIGGVIFRARIHLQPPAKQERPELGYQLLTGIATATHTT